MFCPKNYVVAKKLALQNAIPKTPKNWYSKKKVRRRPTPIFFLKNIIFQSALYQNSRRLSRDRYWVRKYGFLRRHNNSFTKNSFKTQISLLWTVKILVLFFEGNRSQGSQLHFFTPFPFPRPPSGDPVNQKFMSREGTVTER